MMQPHLPPKESLFPVKNKQTYLILDHSPPPKCFFYRQKTARPNPPANAFPPPRPTSEDRKTAELKFRTPDGASVGMKLNGIEYKGHKANAVVTFLRSGDLKREKGGGGLNRSQFEGRFVSGFYQSVFFEQNGRLNYKGAIVVVM